MLEPVSKAVLKDVLGNDSDAKSGLTYEHRWNAGFQESKKESLIVYPLVIDTERSTQEGYTSNDHNRCRTTFDREKLSHENRWINAS